MEPLKCIIKKEIKLCKLRSLNYPTRIPSLKPHLNGQTFGNFLKVSLKKGPCSNEKVDKFIMLLLYVESFVDEDIQNNLELEVEGNIKDLKTGNYDEDYYFKDVVKFTQLESHAVVQIPLVIFERFFNDSHLAANCYLTLTYMKPIPNPVEIKQHNYPEELLSQEHDFSFIVNKKEIKVHKSIMSSASVVFEKMFTIDMIEKKSNTCVISNFDTELFLIMKDFIYKRELKDTHLETYIQIYEIADFYQVDDLIEYVRWKIYVILRKDLCDENAEEMYDIASQYGIQYLIDDCWFLIKYNILKIDKPIANEPLTEMKNLTIVP